MASWEVLTSWGNNRLAAEVLGEGARQQLSLGNRRTDDVQLGHDAQLLFTRAPDGLAVEFSAGVTGTLRQGGDWPRKLSELVERGVVSEAGSRWRTTLRSGDALELRVGTLTVRAREATVTPARLPIELTGPVILLLALGAVILLLSSVVAPPPTVQHLVRAARADCGTGPDPACALTRDDTYPLAAGAFTTLLTSLRTADAPSRVAICERSLRWAHLTANQLAVVLGFIEDDTARLELAKLAAPRVVNPWQAVRFATRWRDPAQAEAYSALMRTQVVVP